MILFFIDLVHRPSAWNQAPYACSREGHYNCPHRLRYSCVLLSPSRNVPEGRLCIWSAYRQRAAWWQRSYGSYGCWNTLCRRKSRACAVSGQGNVPGSYLFRHMPGRGCHNLLPDDGPWACQGWKELQGAAGSHGRSRQSWGPPPPNRPWIRCGFRLHPGCRLWFLSGRSGWPSVPDPHPAR